MLKSKYSEKHDRLTLTLKFSDGEIRYTMSRSGARCSLKASDSFFAANPGAVTKITAYFTHKTGETNNIMIRRVEAEAKQFDTLNDMLKFPS